jgi:hypothetical protein
MMISSSMSHSLKPSVLGLHEALSFRAEVACDL